MVPFGGFDRTFWGGRRFQGTVVKLTLDVGLAPRWPLGRPSPSPRGWGRGREGEEEGPSKGQLGPEPHLRLGGSRFYRSPKKSATV